MIKLIKLIGIFLIAFTLGFLVAPSEVTKTETKEVVKVDEAREANWRELKATDDKVFVIAGEGFNVCSKMVVAVGTGDLDALDEGTRWMEDAAVQLGRIASVRNSLIAKLGLNGKTD